jgi:hypothetical protein
MMIAIPLERSHLRVSGIPVAQHTGVEVAGACGRRGYTRPAIRRGLLSEQDGIHHRHHRPGPVDRFTNPPRVGIEPFEQACLPRVFKLQKGSRRVTDWYRSMPRQSPVDTTSTRA